jgi:hypothetical protein
MAVSMNPAAGQHLSDRRQPCEQPIGRSAALTAAEISISGSAASLPGDEPGPPDFTGHKEMRTEAEHA